MEDEQEERREIEAYLKQHHLQAYLGDAVNDIVKDRPVDPLLKLGDALRACSDASRQIQKVHGRQVLNGEALPALEVEIQTGQGPVHAAVSLGPFDEDEDVHEGRGLSQAVENIDFVLAEVLAGKDPIHQTKIDKLLTREPTLKANVVTAASVACCKAGARQSMVPVYEHIGAMCNNTEGSVPRIGFSILNGGHLSASSLWVQDIFIVPGGAMATVSDRLRAVSKVHRTIEVVARNAGQELLQRGPRGGYCNGAGTFEHLMKCLVDSLSNAGCLMDVEIVVDVHASKLLPQSEEGPDTKSGQSTSYDLTTFAADQTALELTSTQALFDTYVEWLEKFPITALIEPFAPADITMSKELLSRGHQVLRAKSAASAGDVPATTMEGLDDGVSEGLEAISREDENLFTIIAQETVPTTVELHAVNEERGANALIIDISNISTVSDSLALARTANEIGWSVLVSAVREQELEGEFLADLSVGLRAARMLMGGLRSASTIAAGARFARIEDDGVKHIGAE